MHASLHTINKVRYSGTGWKNDEYRNNLYCALMKKCSLQRRKKYTQLTARPNGTFVYIYYSIMYVDCVQHRFVKFGTRKQLTEKVEKYKVEIYFTQSIAVRPLITSGSSSPLVCRCIYRLSVTLSCRIGLHCLT